MDWRNTIVLKSFINNYLNDILSQVENRFISDNQIGGNINVDEPSNVLFEWRAVKAPNGDEVIHKYWSTFRRHQVKAKFNIKHNFGAFSDLFSIEKSIDNMFNNFMSKQLSNFNDNDLASINIEHENLHGNNLFIPPFKIRDFNPQSFFNAIYEVSQSNKSFLLNGVLSLEVNITKAIRGSGNSSEPPKKKAKIKPPVTKDEIINNSRSVVEIHNLDNGCAFHAIVVCIAKHEISNDYEWQCIRRNTNNLRSIRAKALALKCGYTLEKSIDIYDFSKIQSFINYQIIVIDSANKKNRLYIGDSAKPKKIYLLHTNKIINKYHYDSIVNIKGYMQTKYYCEHCHTSYRNIYQHMCIFICEKCKKFPKCSNSNIEVLCRVCNISFYSKSCYDNHLKDVNNVCKNVKKCKRCFQVYYGYKHVCDEKVCKICYEKYRLENHYCYLRPKNIEKLLEEDNNNKMIGSYDIESLQKIYKDGVYHHIPDLLIYMGACNLCWIDEPIGRKEKCDLCGDKKVIFFGLDCIKKFGDFIYNNLAKKAAENNCYLYLYAHNAKGYDNHFILNDLFQRNFNGVSVMMCGNRVLKASVGNIKFLDSLLIFQQPLAALPKAFGFESIVKKGYFPHYFHTKENLNYSGGLPDKKYFGTDFMKPKQLKDFLKWHAEETEYLKKYNLSYNLKDELIKYCENDVLILLYCVQVFRKIFKTVTGLDPITRCFTLASMGLEIFKAKILSPLTIGVTPIRGYGNKGTFSRIGNIWIDYMEKQMNCKFEREVPIDNQIVDAYNQETNTILQYQGCYFHCHHCTFKDKRDEKIVKRNGTILNKTPNEIYQETAKI